MHALQNSSILLLVATPTRIHRGNMSTNSKNNIHRKQEPILETSVPPKPMVRVGLFVLFLACGAAVLLFGVNYFKLFPTNGNIVYAIVISTVFLVAALLLKRSTTLARFWQIAYAFFVASAVNLVSVLFGDYDTSFLAFLRVSNGTNQGTALLKLYEVVLIIITIIVLTKLAGMDLGSLFIKKGNMKRAFAFGGLVFFNFATSVFIFFGTSYPSTAKLGTAVLWGLVFSLSNGFSEELWFRGLFIKKLQPLIGSTGTLVLTSIWFALLHLFAVAYLPAAVLPIFLVNTLTLGLACGYLMMKSDNIWGAWLIHAAADFFLFVATLAVH
jgi:membrane protease YdiL (CAAX protease family)